MNRTLKATLCPTFDRKPLAVVDGLPGGYAELTPAQLRELAAGLLRIAIDTESQPTGRDYRRLAREYDLN